MVTVFLRGGLGNQMFQYAAGLALAKKNGTKLVLDTVFLNDRWPRTNFTYRTFDLDIFTLELQLTKLSKISEGVPIPGFWLALDLALMKSADILRIQKIVREREDFIFEPQALIQAKDVVLWGRWQNEKYFSDIEDDIRRDFTFRHQLIGQAASIADDIRSSNSISVHVRRGDFVAFENVTKMMGQTDLSYYKCAADYMIKEIEKPIFFIFSDDIGWCKKNLILPGQSVYIPISVGGPKAAFHMELMSLCKHNIVANSTFSWWGAWLNNNAKKIVIAPKRWYADGHSENNEIMPERWIKI